MPQGDKSSYTNKQKRQAAHIEAGYKKKGLSTKTAEARAWATVNKLTGGGKKSGPSRKKYPGGGTGRRPSLDFATSTVESQGAPKRPQPEVTGYHLRSPGLVPNSNSNDQCEGTSFAGAGRGCYAEKIPTTLSRINTPTCFWIPGNCFQHFPSRRQPSRRSPP